MTAPNKRPAVGAAGGNEESEMHGKYSIASPASKLLPRLERVKELGSGRWIARCPAHEDRSPSFTIKETNDGTLLIRCWAGCGAADVMAAVGLELADLFPDRVQGRGPLRQGERWIPRDVLRAVASECNVVVIAADHLAAGRALDNADRERLKRAAVIIHGAAREVA